MIEFIAIAVAIAFIIHAMDNLIQVWLEEEDDL